MKEKLLVLLILLVLSACCKTSSKSHEFEVGDFARLKVNPSIRVMIIYKEGVKLQSYLDLRFYTVRLPDGSHADMKDYELEPIESSDKDKYKVKEKE